MTETTRARWAATQGFSVLELLFICAITCVIVGMAMIVGPAVLAKAKADSGSSTLLAHLRMASEQAISQRRNMLVQFVAPNRLLVSRIEVPGPGTTVLLDARLESSAEYVRFETMADTPDLFGGAEAVDFGDAVSYTFTSEGAFVDQTGDELNGTIFVGLPNDPMTAQAVTIFGPTGYLRSWRWIGRRWIE